MFSGVKKATKARDSAAQAWGKVEVGSESEEQRLEQTAGDRPWLRFLMLAGGCSADKLGVGTASEQ